MKNKLLKIYNHFTPTIQRNKLCEEFRELQDELYRYVVIGDESDDLLTEIADMLILILQFAYDYGFEDEMIKEEMENKINRTIERIESGYYK